MDFLSYTDITAITHHPTFLLSLLVVWLLPLIIYVVVGLVAKGKSPSGQSYSKSMIQYPNFWYSCVIWFFIQSGLILLLIVFPLWLKLIA